MEPTSPGEPVEVRYHPRDASVFLDMHYLTKGVAGALFWKLAREHVARQRSEFSLRELRLAGHELRLPEVQDNLGVRLLLLQRRLAARGAAVQIHRSGRGRFRIEVSRPLVLIVHSASDGPSLPDSQITASRSQRTASIGWPAPRKRAAALAKQEAAMCAPSPRAMAM